MKLKKSLCIILVLFVALFIFGMTNVNAATEYEENLIYKIAQDGKNATLKTVKPENASEAYLILSNVVNNMLNEEEYTADVHCTNDELTECAITFYKSGKGPIDKTYNINVTYDEPEENKAVNSILSKMKTPKDDVDFENFYLVSDLNIINLHMTETNINKIWSQNAARHLKFSNDFIEMSDGSDVSFYLETRCGGGGDMFLFAMGETSLFYDGYNYANICTGVYLQRVLYIPKNTKETPEAYVKAAQKRINDYLGKDNEVIVTYGGKLESLEENGDDIVSREKTDGNYYNITIKDKTYKFYIMKGSDKQLEKPKYKGKHIKSDIKITTDDSTVPLDTHLTVKTIKNDKIKDAIGTDIYDAYDIKLYSDIKNDSITKLKNGKFLVSIPVSSLFNGKNVVVYYLNDNNELETYETTVKDGIASFETNHFSTYILAEKIETQDTSNTLPEDSSETITEDKADDTLEYIVDDTLDDTPQTGSEDIVLVASTLVAVISLAGIVMLKKYIK